jgi:hypothetical protein
LLTALTVNLRVIKKDVFITEFSDLRSFGAPFGIRRMVYAQPFAALVDDLKRRNSRHKLRRAELIIR